MNGVITHCADFTGMPFCLHDADKKNKTTPQRGLEPLTTKLKAWRSTSELLGFLCTVRSCTVLHIQKGGLVVEITYILCTLQRAFGSGLGIAATVAVFGIMINIRF